MKRTKAIDIIAFLLMLLFLYASIVKLIDFEQFKTQLSKSPLVTHYASILALAVPLSEIAIAALLVLPSLRLLGFFASFTLMFLFTGYIVFVLTLSPYVPCSCGGILNTMGWTEHLIFNICYTIIALSGIYLQVNIDKNKDTFPIPTNL